MSTSQWHSMARCSATSRIILRRLQQQQQQQLQQHHQTACFLSSSAVVRWSSSATSATTPSSSRDQASSSHHQRRNLTTSSTPPVSTPISSEMTLSELLKREREELLASFVRHLSSNDAASRVASADHEPVDPSVLTTEASASSSSYSPAALMSEHESDPDRLLQKLGMRREDLFQLARQSPIPLRLSDMYRYATAADRAQRLRNAQFLHHELPIRVAQRAVDLLTLPHGLSEAPAIRQVACSYIGYVHLMQSFPKPQTFAEEEQFTDLLQSLVLDRTSIPVAIGQGLTAWHEEQGDSVGDDESLLQEMEDALYRFFTARVGLRFLTEHHVLSCSRESAQALRHVTSMFPHDDGSTEDGGCIRRNIGLVEEVEKVAALVVRQTRELFGISPEIEILDCMDKSKREKDFTYVPHHLHYMMGELLKNSCRATVRSYLRQQQQDGEQQQPLGTLTAQHYQQQRRRNMMLNDLEDDSTASSADELPPIRVVIVKGDEDVTIKVADKGGGIPRSRMAKIWKFAHSTADADEHLSDFGRDSISGAQLRGFGLPLCRIYARYLGGELTLKSMEGFGLDAYLHLPRLGEACENLPVLVRLSPGEGTSMPSRSIRNFSTAAGNQGSTQRTARRDPNEEPSKQGPSKAVPVTGL